jgi:hypothetical protein
MNPLAKLFSRTPSAVDIRLQLKQIERNQRQKRRELDVLEQQKQAKVEAAVAAKKAGQQELGQDIFRDLRQIEIDHGYVKSDLRRLSLSKTALTAFLRKLEMLEEKKDHRSVQNLMRSYNSSSIQKTIDQAEVDDDTFGSMLQDILGETESTVTEEKAKEDKGFAEFDLAIGEMAAAESAGARETSAMAAPPGLEVKARLGHVPRTVSDNQQDVEYAIRETKKKIDELKKKVEETESEIAKLLAREESQRRRAAITECFEERQDLERQADEAKNEADKLEDYLDTIKDQLNDKQKLLADLQSQLA